MPLTKSEEYSLYKVIYYFFTTSFFIDALINKFYSLPIALAGMALCALVLFIRELKVSKLIVFLILAMLYVKSNIYTISIEDFGYFLYVATFLLLLLCSSPCEKIKWFSIRHLIFLFLLSSLFYWVYIIGVDYTPHEADLTASGADPEYYRSYHSGLFRAPHFPSYLFYFLLLSIVYFRKEFKSKFFWFVLCVSCSLGVITSGSRTPIVALMVSIILVNIFGSIKRIIVAIIFIVFIFLVFYNIEAIMRLTEGTFIYQYFSFVHTITNNFERLSRVQLFMAFINGMGDFNFITLLVGKSFFLQFDYIYKEVGQRLWFHNDLLAIIFSYGLLGFSILLYTLIVFYKKYILKSSSLIIKIYFFSVVIFAIFNGIVYHPTIIFIFILFGMLSYEKRVSNNIIC